MRVCHPLPYYSRAVTVRRIARSREIAGVTYNKCVSRFARHPLLSPLAGLIAVCCQEMILAIIPLRKL